MAKSMQHNPQGPMKNSKAIAAQVSKLDAGTTTRSSGPGRIARNNSAASQLQAVQASQPKGSPGTVYRK